MALVAPTTHAKPLESPCGGCVRRSHCMLQALNHAAPDGRGAHSQPDLPVTSRLLHRGDFLYEQGERASNTYVVAAGALKVWTGDASGDQQVVGFLSQGDLAGAELTRDGRHGSTAQALDTTSVCVVSTHKLMSALAGSPAAARAVFDSMGARLDDMANLLLRVGQKNAEQRLASFLVGLLDKQRHLGLVTDRIELPMSRADMASYLSLAVETVSRLLTRLQGAGAVKVQRSHVDVVDLELLRSLAGQSAERHRLH